MANSTFGALRLPKAARTASTECDWKFRWAKFPGGLFTARRPLEGEVGRVFRDGFGGRESGSRLARRGVIPMTKQQKITLSASRDIPFNKLMLSQSNVRHVKAGVSIEELAEDIARRTLLASITVRPVLDDNGAETGMFTIPAGGRRFRALELLVKQKRLNKTALVPCVVRMDGLAEEDSLAENIQRAPLHPLDQFRAFQAMREKGRTEEEIAAAFFVSASVVKQRLKLAAVAPALHDVYAEEEMTLDQLMAFTVNPDHARQEQVWEALQRHYSKQPYEIRRMLTEGAVRASDKRAQFVGLDNYVEAGGDILRDLFQQDDGGWLQDASLLDVMVTEKLAEEAEVIRAEGWKWVEVDTDFPYGHTFGMRRIHGEAEPMSDVEAADYQALKAEYDALEADHAEVDELPEEVDARLGEIETAMEALQDRPIRFEAEDLALAGAFVSIDSSGRLRVERGHVRAEDEPVNEPEENGDVGAETPIVEDAEDSVSSAVEDEEEEDGLKPLSDRLVMELTAHRTLALRNAAGAGPAGRLPRGAPCDDASAVLPLRPRQLRRDRTAQRGLRVAGAGPWRHGLCAGHRPAARDLGAQPAQGVGRPLGSADRVRQLQPRGAVRPLRGDERECRPRSLPAPTPCDRACGCSGRDRRARHGQIVNSGPFPTTNR